MGAYIDAIRFLWNTKLAPHWEYIVPVLLALIALAWILAVYLKGNFRWLPTWAIARVTVLDSIGRLEVIMFLLIGFLVIAINGILPFTTQGWESLSNNPLVQDKLQELTGNTGITLSKEHQEEMLYSLIWQGALLFGDFFVTIIGFALAMLVLPNEINRGVIQSILPKPISRSEYVFGKFFGIWLIVSGCFLFFALELFLFIFGFNLIRDRYLIDWHLVMAMCLFPMKYAALLMLIMGLTLRLPEVPAGIMGLAVFACGHFADRIFEMAHDPAMHIGFRVALNIAYWLMPHLSEVSFNILSRDSTYLTDWNVLWGWVWHMSAYNIVLLALLIWLFKRRSY